MEDLHSPATLSRIRTDLQDEQYGYEHRECPPLLPKHPLCFLQRSHSYISGTPASTFGICPQWYPARWESGNPFCYNRACCRIKRTSPISHSRSRPSGILQKSRVQIQDLSLCFWDACLHVPEKWAFGLLRECPWWIHILHTSIRLWVSLDSC